MNPLSIQLQHDPPAFAPGDVIEGRAEWTLEQPADAVLVRLFWFTEGKGGRDVGIVDEVRFDHPPATYASEFRFTAPQEPWSYDGTLLSIQWGIEIVCKGRKDTERVLLVIAPNRTAVRPAL
jgi:hypothetical protein